ncbi:MAG: tetratricopeptide repeat protein, partial [Phormidesmis sp.]
MANPNVQLQQNAFLAENQRELSELLTFIDFADGLTIGFIEVNQEGNKALLVEALKASLVKTDAYLEVVNFSLEQDLRYLRDALLQRVGNIRADKKLVLLIQGLEAAIGTDGTGAYPPILQDLNFVRDAYRQSLPHPLLFVLPDYAITRVSKYAPDFWAWKSGLFRFKASPEGLEKLKAETFEQLPVRVASNENQAQIDQLKQLLMELKPTGKPIAAKDAITCAEIDYKIGSAYLTQQQPNKAEEYLIDGLKVLENHPSPTLQQSIQRKLGNAYEQMRRFEDAVFAYERALEQARKLDQPEKVSIVLSDLGDVALSQRQFERARDFYNQSMEIDVARDDRNSQASTYHQLGNVAEELREYEQARSHYQKALDISVVFNDRYSQASTYHQLGRVAEELREYEQARSHYQRALDIKVEFNDRYSQASTYHQLG